MKCRRLTNTVIALALMFCMLGGCMFAKLEEELEEFEETFYIVGGVITNQSPHQKDIVVFAYEDTPGEKAPVKAIILESSGDYAMEVKRGNYFLMAFEDRNGNLDHDPDEYAGWYGAPDVIEARKERMPADTPHGRRDLDFTLSEAKPFPAGFIPTRPSI